MSLAISLKINGHPQSLVLEDARITLLDLLRIPPPQHVSGRR